MARASRAPTYRIQVIERVIAILDCFLKESGGLTLVDINRRVDLHKSTLYRLLEVLRQHSLLKLDEGTGRYFLGVKMFQLGLAALGPLDLGRTAAAPLKALAARTGENVNLGVLEGRHVVYVAKPRAGSN
jgi:DNA-binding IclR family transcriptional regulator